MQNHSSGIRILLLALAGNLSGACGAGPVTAATPVPAGGPAGYAASLERAAGRASLDYSREEYWACSGREGDRCHRDYPMARRLTDGTETDFVLRPAVAPTVDCFYIYPTVDFNVLQSANHDDMTNVRLPARTVTTQAGPFSAACRVFAPYYRQGTFGAYAEAPETGAFYFRRAFADVAAAFEYYLATWNQGRPLVIIGHSQGAQMASYLLHGYFDGDRFVTAIAGSRRSRELRERLVLALPIGFGVFTPRGARVGGSFSDLPLCDAGDEWGCVIHFRSYPEGFAFDGGWGRGADAVLAAEGLLHREMDRDGDEIACINPAVGAPVDATQATDGAGAPVDAGALRLAAATYLVDLFSFLHAGPRTDPAAQHLPGRYTTACRNDPLGGPHLAVGLHAPPGGDLRGDPLDLDGMLANSGLGLHLYDFQIAQGDLIEQIRRRSRGRKTP